MPIMPIRVRSFSALSLLALLFSLTAAVPARAQFNIGPTKGQVVGAGVGAGAAIAGIGVGVYFATRAPRITGCLASTSGDLELQGD